MRVQQTLRVDLDRLQSQGDDANLVIRLMRAADDVALANLCLGQAKNPGSTLAMHSPLGASRYFIRLQCGHLYEAMDLLKEFVSRPSLTALLSKCSRGARVAFARASECAPGGCRRSDFEAWVRPIRNRLAFHYDPRLIGKALSRRKSRRSTITRGTDISLWRYGVADDLDDTIVCRLIWKIPESADLREEANRRERFGTELCQDFLDFVGEFVFLYIQENAEC